MVLYHFRRAIFSMIRVQLAYVDQKVPKVIKFNDLKWKQKRTLNREKKQSVREERMVLYHFRRAIFSMVRVQLAYVDQKVPEVSG